MDQRTPKLNLKTLHRSAYGWPLRQMRIPQAHKITRGSKNVIVAVIDLGYRHHPHHKGHLWVNPSPSRGDVHGWDCADDDDTLEFSGGEESDYYRDHHAFIVGEVITCAPACPVMVVRVGYGDRDSWWRGIDYAVEHGAKVLIMPHGYIPVGADGVTMQFYQGTDFAYPADNPKLRRSMEAAHDAGCLIFRGTADNRGRRVAAFDAATAAAVTVGSSNLRGDAADIACSADCVEVAAPGGQDNSSDPKGQVWSTGGAGAYTSCVGGCMAAGFAGSVAALIWSRFPKLTNAQVRQIMCNTATLDEWDDRLGWGVLDAARAVELDAGRIEQRLRVKRSACTLAQRRGKPVLRVDVENRGALDVRQCLVAAFTGDPGRPAAPKATMQKPVLLATRQIGHAVGPVRGLHAARFEIALTEKPPAAVWLQVCTLDLHGSDAVQNVRVKLP